MNPSQMRPSQPQQLQQQDVTVQLLQALAQSQTVTINSLQRLNERLESENSEYQKNSTNQTNQVKSLTTQLEDLQKRYDELSAQTPAQTTSVVSDDTSDNISQKS